MIMENDITILFSDLISLIVPLQTWNEKYYKYAIIKNGLKSLLLVPISGPIDPVADRRGFAGSAKDRL